MKLTEIETVLNRRRSVRAYLPDPVARETLEVLLKIARRAPSGGNLQPGCFHVLTGEALTGLVEQLVQASDIQREPVAEYSYFPKKMARHLRARQFGAGRALYQALGIERKDKAARNAQFALNYRFFDAPVGIVVTIDPSMGKGCFMDLGMAIMSLFASAESRGLSSTGIGALANYADIAHDYLQLPDNEMVVCGIALGYADTQHPVNTVVTEREPLENFTMFYGFDDK
ncbi:MAG: oxidoreductase [Proteobacteria bacterium]|nr:MAG: oxidoreductase [Pseudomonadota bacterium]